MNTRIKSLLVVAAIIVFGSAPSFAATSGGAALPWEGALTTFTSSLSGPVAFTLAVLAFFVTGGILLWGGELGDFVKRLVQVLFGIAVIAFSTTLVTTFFPSVTGALVR